GYLSVGVATRVAPRLRTLVEMATCSGLMDLAYGAAVGMVGSCVCHLDLACAAFVRCDPAKRSGSHGPTPQFLFIGSTLLVGIVLRARTPRLRRRSSLHLHNSDSYRHSGGAADVWAASLVRALC